MNQPYTLWAFDGYRQRTWVGSLHCRNLLDANNSKGLYCVRIYLNLDIIPAPT